MKDARSVLFLVSVGSGGWALMAAFCVVRGYLARAVSGESAAVAKENVSPQTPGYYDPVRGRDSRGDCDTVPLATVAGCVSCWTACDSGTCLGLCENLGTLFRIQTYPDETLPLMS